MQPGRNNPCPCGSGKKYKKCCADKQQVVERLDSSQRLGEARRAYDARDYRRTLGLVLPILNQDPNHPDATQLGGAAFLQIGQWNEALSLLEKSVHSRPKDPLSCTNVVLALQNLGRWEEAEHWCRRALTLNPSLAEAHNSFAVVLGALGKSEDAISEYRSAIKCAPTNALFRYNLGSFLHSIPGQIKEAEQLYREALALQPDFGAACGNLGALCLEQKRPQEAEEWLLKAHRANPRGAHIMANLADAYLQLSDHSRAIEWSRRAIKHDDFLPAYGHLGFALELTGDIEGAVRVFHHLLKKDLHSVFAYKNLFRLQIAGRFLEDAYTLLTSLPEQEYLEHCPLPDVINVLQQFCDFPRLAAAWAKFHSSIDSVEKDVCALSVSLMLLNYDDSIVESTVYELHRRWGQQIAESVRAVVSADVAQPRVSLPGRIRIGYLSADFRNHSVGHLIRNVVAEHDRSRFEVFCYSNVKRPDKETDFFKQVADQYIDVSDIDDVKLEYRIRTDAIDILVDLSGHTGESRIASLAARPAPMQITYLGYPNTSGTRYMDYWVTDVHAHEEADPYHTEELLKLPECFLCFGSFADRPIQAQPPALRRGYVTFGSFNNFAKLSQRTLELWAKILVRSPNSRLLLKANFGDSEYIRANIGRELARHGVDLGRLIFLAHKTNQNEHLDLYNEIDIALDPFPYNGTTTTCEALWMGVPVITLVGKLHRQRTSFSILKNADVCETIAWSEEQYVDTAVRLANNLGDLYKLRGDIAAGIRRSIICNPQWFTRRYEELLLRAWSEKQSKSA